MSDLYVGSDGVTRCSWSNQCEEYIDYHDSEWGMPVTCDIKLFEKLCLEAFQCGLSWRTVLLKREAFRAAFCGFDFNLVARFGEAEISELLENEMIIRNRRKIEAVIHNAKMAQALIEDEGSIAAFVWRYRDFERGVEMAQCDTISTQSVALAKALKKRGWKFLGPTTVFAFMQAMGLINDHLEGCICRERVLCAQQRLNFAV